MIVSIQVMNIFVSVSHVSDRSMMKKYICILRFGMCWIIVDELAGILLIFKCIRENVF